jgi:parallel beta-helix repeat protein
MAPWFLSGAGLNTGPLLTITGDNVVLYKPHLRGGRRGGRDCRGCRCGHGADCTFRHAGLSGAGCRDWAITGNAFNDLVGTSTSAAAAITFGGGADNLTITDNVIVGCDRGIALSALAGPKIRNNFIADAAPPATPVPRSTLAASPPRRSTTIASIKPQLRQLHRVLRYGRGRRDPQHPRNKPITATGTATATLGRQRHLRAGQLVRRPGERRPAPSGARSGVVDAGTTIPGLNVDIDGDARPSGSAYDIGADEAQADTLAPTCPPASTLRTWRPTR